MERAVIPSAGAESAVTKLQIALNNLLIHVRDSVFYSVEMAKPGEAVEVESVKLQKSLDTIIDNYVSQNIYVENEMC